MSLACRVMGHQFKPRFHTYLGPKVEQPKKLGLARSAQQRAMEDEAARERKEMYVCDVCERCGTVLKTIDDMLDLSDLNPSLKADARNRFETVHSSN